MTPTGFEAMGEDLMGPMFSSVDFKADFAL
jgi:hypothetical protein